MSRSRSGCARSRSSSTCSIQRSSGLPLLAAYLIGSQLIVRFTGAGTLARIIGESLVIVGWVANWRPMEIFLYEWVPIRRRRRLYERLAEARIEVRPSKPRIPALDGGRIGGSFQS